MRRFQNKRHENRSLARIDRVFAKRGSEADDDFNTSTHDDIRETENGR